MKFKRFLAAGLAAAVAAAYMPQAVLAEEQPQSGKQVDFYAGLTFYTDMWRGRESITESELLWYDGYVPELWNFTDAHITGDGTYTVSFEIDKLESDDEDETGWVLLDLQTNIDSWKYDNLDITIDSFKVDGREVESGKDGVVYYDRLNVYEEGYHGITEEVYSYYVGFYNEWIPEYSVIDATEDFGNKVEVTFTVTGFDTAGYYFEELDDGTYAVAGYYGGDTDIVIPDEYKGKKVTAIADEAFEWNTYITSVVIPDSVTAIGSNAFYCCESLESVIIPDSVTTIGEQAFSDCMSLKSVQMTNNIEKIEYRVFSGCSSLESITISESVTTIDNEAFFGCSSLTAIVIPDSVTTIGESAFANCTSLESVTLSKSITKIDNNVFRTCSSLKEITIPDSVTTIGGGAFSSCTSLESVTIPDSVEVIGSQAFYNCSALKTVNISENVSEIGAAAFADCKSLLSIDVDEANANYKDLDGVLFTKDGKILIQFPTAREGSYDVPEGTEIVSSFSFAFCEGIESVSLPESITQISSMSFYYAVSLKSVNIPEGVTEIANSAFASCESLESVIIPNSVTLIDIMAFSSCTTLKSVTIPKSVEKINDAAFGHCSPDLTIYGYKGTAAETYANDNEITFVALDKEDETTDSSVSTNPAETTTDTNTENGNTQNSDTNNDKNEPTGVVLALLPAAFAAVGMILSRKRK